jgi:hypothetical protein
MQTAGALLDLQRTSSVPDGRKKAETRTNAPRHNGSLVSFVVHKMLNRIREEYIIGANIDHTFILAPEERPILLVLQEVGFQQEHTGNDSAGDEGKIRPVTPICSLLRTRSDTGNKGDIRIRVATKNISGNAS